MSLTLGAVRRAQVPLVSASLSPTLDPALLDTSSISLALATTAMVPLCIINHVVFFSRARSRR